MSTDEALLTIDFTAGAAYVRNPDRSGQVARTIELTPAVLIDLDEFGALLGVEVLDLKAVIPWAALHPYRLPRLVTVLLSVLKYATAAGVGLKETGNQ